MTVRGGGEMCKQVEHGDMSSNHKRINIKYDKIARYRKWCVQITGHHRDSSSLNPTGRSFRVAWGGEVSKSTPASRWGSSGINSWTPPLLHIHYITGSHHTGTWFPLPLLCWWHTALSLISTRWSNGSCMDLRLPGGHLCMDERTSPTAQPGKDCSFLDFPATPTLQHDFTIQLGSSIITHQVQS